MPDESDQHRSMRAASFALSVPPAPDSTAQPAPAQAGAHPGQGQGMVRGYAHAGRCQGGASHLHASIEMTAAQQLAAGLAVQVQRQGGVGSLGWPQPGTVAQPRHRDQRRQGHRPAGPAKTPFWLASQVPTFSAISKCSGRAVEGQAPSWRARRLPRDDWRPCRCARPPAKGPPPARDRHPIRRRWPGARPAHAAWARRARSTARAQLLVAQLDAFPPQCPAGLHQTFAQQLGNRAAEDPRRRDRWPPAPPLRAPVRPPSPPDPARCAQSRPPVPRGHAGDRPVAGREVLRPCARA